MVKVYNLRVADWHTYFVGCDEWGFSVWAHNADAVYLEQIVTNLVPTAKGEAKVTKAVQQALDNPAMTKAEFEAA
jgi:hypothetical protein